MYSRWSYNGERHSISSLWKFPRSVLSSKQIASGIYEVNIRNWTFGLTYEHGLLVLLDHDMDLIQNAIGTAGLEWIESAILISVRKADPRPFVALLLAHLPNLTTLYAEIPELDFFVYEVFRKAANDGQYMDRPLKNLRELHICSAWNYYQHDVEYERYKYYLSIHGYPVHVFRIPSVQRFSVFDFSAGDVAWLFETRGIALRSSSITDLTLVYNQNFKVPISGPNTSALTAIPKMLVNLCIHWDDPRVVDELFGPQISNADLWTAIQQHANSLESLDLYKACTRAFPSQHSANASRSGSIQHFTRLRRLCIQPEVLLGGCCGGSYAPFQLKDTLPPGLRSLTLYGEEGLVQNPTLSQQLRDVLNSTSFPLLDHIALESTYHGAGLYETNINPPHYDVERACKDNGRNYETGAA
jgi:hypothetical protein